MYWILASERTDEYELSLDRLPPLLVKLGIGLADGALVTQSITTIDVPYEQHSEEYKTDNIVCSPGHGWLINKKFKDVLDSVGLTNIQYFGAKMINTESGEISEEYCIANIIGAYSCVDTGSSELEYFDSGRISFIDKLVLNLTDGTDYGHIFRIGEYLSLVVISDQLKQAIEAAGITGVKIYKPEEFSI